MNNNLKTISGLIIGVLIGSLLVHTIPKYVNIEFKHKQQEEQVEPKQEYQYKQETPSYNEDEILTILLTGEYTLTVDGVSYVYNTEEMLKALYENPQYTVEHYNGNQYLIQVSNGNNFVTFLVEEGAEDIAIVELYHNGEFFEGEDASSTLPYVIYEEIFNEEDGTLTKKQQVAKEEVKEQEKSSKKEEKTIKEEKKQETPKTCKWCYMNQLPNGANENDKCSECQAESWNFYCNDCNKELSLEEYWGCGHDTGFCPPCYDKYLEATSNNDADHKTYYCDKCNKDCTYKNFLQDFEGFSIICEGCLLDLGY